MAKNPLCNLCKINDANKKNSHIIPRYLGVSLATTDDNKRRVYTLDEYKPAMNYSYSQDTPKEDYILCDKCEKHLSDNYETEIAKKFYYVNFL